MELYSLLRAQKSSHLFGWELGISNDPKVSQHDISLSSLHTLLAPAHNIIYYLLLTTITKSCIFTITKQEAI
jgi:hypothetical protein